MVACRPLPAEAGAEVRLVPNQDQAADDLILSEIHPSDLVVTRDLGLAQRVIQSGASAMNDRGNIWQPDTLHERLSIARAAQTIYASGLEQRPLRSFGKKEIDAFSGSFDRWVQNKIRGYSKSAEEQPS